MIRPQPARWFEILAARDDATLALEALAATGAVELEARPAAALPPVFADLRPLLAAFAELALRYHAYWPAGAHRASAFPEPPATTLARCLARLRAWAEEAEPRDRADRSAWASRARRAPALASRARRGRRLDDLDFARGSPPARCCTRDWSCSRRTASRRCRRASLARRVDLDGTMACTRCARRRQRRRTRCARAAGRRAEGAVYDMPPWLQADAAANEALRRRRGSKPSTTRSAGAAHARGAARKHDLPHCARRRDRLQWVIENVRALESGELFCWITGWTSDLRRRPHRARARALGRARAAALPAAAAETRRRRCCSPIRRWARPFEVFSRALGMPARNEADPTCCSRSSCR